VSFEGVFSSFASLANQSGIDVEDKLAFLFLFGQQHLHQRIVKAVFLSAGSGKKSG
jgi:hypothetical protein